GARHAELRLTGADVAGTAPELLARLDQPLADPSLVATHALAVRARREVTVVVGGEGADELFGGYPRYRWLARAGVLEGRLPRRAAAAAASALGLAPGRTRRLADVVRPAELPERQLDWVVATPPQTLGRIRGPRLREARGDGVLPLIA